MFADAAKSALFVIVDSITQAVLGAAVGEAVLGRRMRNRAIGWGAFFGTLPDLDVLVSPFLSHAWNLWWHRGPSHSLLAMVLISWWLTKPLSRLWKRDKISSQRTGWFLFLVWSTHVLIDCFTSYGTSVFWPFWNHRVAFNNLFIIDPLFTAPMLVALVWLAFLRKKKQLPRRRRLNAWGMGISALYVLLSVVVKLQMSSRFEEDLSRREITFQRRMETPTPFNILLWRSVVDRGDEFLVGYRSVFDAGNQAVRWTVIPKQAEALNGLMEYRETRIVTWFSQGWWVARPHVKGAWVGDLRFGEVRVFGGRPDGVDLRLPFAWDIVPDEAGETLRPKRMDRVDPGGAMKRIGWRMVGKTDTWGENSRLEGATGSLPEELQVIE